MYKSNCAECVRDAKASGATFTFTSCLGKPPLAPLPPLPLQPCWWKHIKGEWLQVNLVQPGHQPRDDTTHRWSHPPFYIIVSALSEQWIVNRLVTQPTCRTIVTLWLWYQVDLPLKREYWIFSFIWITWALTPYPISIQSQPFSVVAHHCLL